MTRNRNMRGGNANVRPIEYYGGNSGRYFETLPPTGTFAYGNYHPVSHGVVNENGNNAGPNIGVYPGSSLQTGGYTGGHCGCETKRSRSGRRTKRSSRRSARGRSGRRSARSRSGRRSARGRSGRRTRVKRRY